MKPIGITLILVILVTPAICFGEWLEYTTHVFDEETALTYYIHFESIKEHEGYVYFWELRNYSGLDSKQETLNQSTKSYYQGDCNILRTKQLTSSLYKEPMANGLPNFTGKPDEDWTYPSPDTIGEGILEAVCLYVKLKQDKE